MKNYFRPYLYLTLLVFLFFQICPTSFSQEIEFERIPNELGLSQNFISALCFDHDGFLWVGTKDGLNRFDGYRFKVYQHEPFDSTSISGNYIKTIFEDSQGRLWVGTTDGLNLFDRKTEVFTRLQPLTIGLLPSEPVTENYPGLTNRDINVTLEDQGGNIWVGTMHGGLIKIELPHDALDFAQAKYTAFTQTEAENSLWDLPITHLAIEENGNVWALAYGKISIIKTDGKTGEHYIERMHWEDFDPQWPNYDQTDFRFNDRGIDMEDLRFHSLLQDDNGAVWVKTAGGFGKWKSNESEFESYHLDVSLGDYEQPPMKGANGPQLFDRNGYIWSSGGWSVVVYDPATFQILTRNFQSEKAKLGLPADGGGRSILEDPVGNIWLGMTGNGLFKYTPQIKKFDGQNGALRWHDNSVRSIYETSDGTLWLGLTSLRLLRMDRKTGRVDPIILERERWSRSYDFELDYVYDMQEDREGNLWVGSERGLFRFELENGKLLDWEFFTVWREEAGEQKPSSVLDIHLDEQGQLWLITHFEFGRFDPESGTLEGHEYLSYSKGDRFAGTYPCIYQQKKGDFYIGTTWGLLHFDPLTSSFTFLTNDPKNPEGLSHPLVKCILPDPTEPERVLWLGTGGGGLNRFDMETGVFTHFKKKDGLPDNVIYGILDDAEGNLWMSTNQGLSKFNPQTGVFKNFTTENGLQDNEFNSAAYFKSPSGELFFGGINGFNAFRPEAVKDNVFLPKVKITDFMLANQPVDFKAENSPLQQPINETESLVLTWRDNIFSFEFASLDLTAPALNQYAFRMEGFHDNWQYIGNKRTATFTNLNPGEYTFQVKGTNHDGIWNEEFTSLKITILPPWWRSWWAYLSYALLVAAAAFGFYKFQLDRKLEHAEADRLKEIDMLKSRLYTNITHEFRTPLTVIMGISDELAVGSQQLIVGEKEKQKIGNSVQLIKRNSKNLLQLINQLLDLSKLDSGQMTLSIIQADIIPYLQYLTESFFSMAEEKNIRLMFYPEVKNLVMDFDELKIQHIVYNLLSNAIKYSKNEGKVIFHAQQEIQEGNPMLLLKVSDTGVGIPTGNLKNIFDRFFQVDGTSTRKGEGTGIGLAITKDLVELMQGNISVESKVGKGTVFTIILPIKNKAPLGGFSSLNPTSRVLSPAIENPQTVSTELGAADAGLPNEKPLLLLVEDNPDIKIYIQQVLENNYQFETAENGKTGLNKAQEIIPDLIISDVMMPEMDGFEMTEKLKTDERTSHIPIVLLTAKASEDAKITGLKTGADAYLVKPFSKEELIVRLEKLLELRQALQRRYATEVGASHSALSPMRAEVDTELTIEDLFLQKLQKAVLINIDNTGLSVEALAKAVTLSQSQLYRKLKALTNETPNHFIRTIRLKRAIEMLKTTDLSISEIAYSVGFSDSNYFSRAFRKEFGKSPRNYRK